jgi:hypothetical protein
MTATSVLRNFLGAYSVTSAIKFGITPPKPIPAMNRWIPKDVGPFAKPEVKVKIVKIAVQIRMTRFLPNLSASGPKTKAPAIIPNKA